MAGKRRGNYTGLTARGSKALSGNPDLAAHIQAIKDAGGKVTKSMPGSDGRTKITFCPGKGPGDRRTIEVGPSDPVPGTIIKRHLRRSATDDYAS